MRDTFTAIDFETAQGYRHTICQMGLVRVEKGIITKTFETLVQPPDNYYWYQFTDIHGITPEMTMNALTFDKVWEQIKPFIKNQNVVAHNASFDVGCLKTTLDFYGIAPPEFNSHCTYRIFGSNLKSLCEEYNIELDHHNALSDALACAKLFLLHLKKESVVSQ